MKSLAAAAKEVDRFGHIVELFEKAVALLRNDPHGWGDPVYRSKFVDGLYCHAILRPIVFRYVIYDQVHAVVLVSVEPYAPFD